MRLVVADTSPINYLVLIGMIDILPRLYGRVLIPTEVLQELRNPGAPAVVGAWLAGQPEWLEVHSTPRDRGSGLEELDSGERAAILLAEMETGSLLLVDDAAARLAASRRGIANTGTLGVLQAAAQENLVDLRSALEQLTRTNFRISRSLVESLLSGISTSH